MTAAVSGGLLSGTGTAPQGASLSVTPAVLPNAGAPAPSDASGVYKGTYNFIAPTRSRSTEVVTGIVREDCLYSTLLSGTLTVQLRSAGSGTYTALMLDDWKESDGPAGRCDPRLINTPDPFTEFNGGSLAPGEFPAESAVSATVLQIVWTDRGSDNGRVQTRTATLIGSVSGSTVWPGTRALGRRPVPGASSCSQR